MKLFIKLVLILVVITFFAGVILSNDYLYKKIDDCYKVGKISYQSEERNSLITYKINSMIIRDEIKTNTFIARFNDEVYCQELDKSCILTKNIGDIVREGDFVSKNNIPAQREGRIINIELENDKTKLYIDLSSNYEFSVDVDVNKIHIINDILNNSINSIKVSGSEVVIPVFHSYTFIRAINRYVLKFRFSSFYELLIDRRPITVSFVKDIYRNQLVFPEECIKYVNFNQTFLYAERVKYLDSEYKKYTTEEIKIPIEKKINDYYIVAEGYYLNFDFVLAD